MLKPFGSNKNALLQLLLLTFCLLLLQFAVAAPAIVIEPKLGFEHELYHFEIADYVLKVANPDENAMQNLVLVVRAVNGAVVVSDGSEADEVQLLFAEIPPKGFAAKEIRVKSVQFSQEAPAINVSAGADTYSHKISVKQNPVMIDARLSKLSLSPGENDSLIFSISNTGSTAIRNISALIIVPDDVQSLSQPLFLSSLEPKESYPYKEFQFVPQADVLGRRNITLRISYSDGERNRIFERVFVVDIQQRLQYLLIIIVLIALLVAVGYAVRRHFEKKASSIKITEVKPPKESG